MTFKIIKNKHMKRITFLLVLTVCLSTITNSQELFYKLRLVDTHLQAMKNTEVTCTEIESRKVIKKITDNNGSVEFHLTEGKLWQIDILEIKNYYMWQLEMPKSGTKMKSQTITYMYSDYLAAMRPPVDRSKIDFEIIKQKFKKKIYPDKEAVVKIVLTKPSNKSKLSKFPVQLTCYKLKKQFQAVSNSAGTVFFKVPVGFDYEVDIEGINSYDVINIPADKPATYTNRYHFEPLNFKETIKNNIVTQKLSKKPSPTSGRYLLKVKFISESEESMSNSTVVISELEGKLSYQAVIDENSEAYFMLPKKKTYVYKYPKQGTLQFYEKVIDLTRKFGIGQGSAVVKIKSFEALRPTKLTLNLFDSDTDINEFFKGEEFRISNFSNKTIPYYAQSYLFFKDKDRIE